MHFEITFYANMPVWTRALTEKFSERGAIGKSKTKNSTINFLSISISSVGLSCTKIQGSQDRLNYELSRL